MGVLAGEPKPPCISGCFSQELLSAPKELALVKLTLDEAMDRFHAGLPGMGPRRDGGVGDAGKGMHRCGEGALLSGVPRADEL